LKSRRSSNKAPRRDALLLYAVVFERTARGFSAYVPDLPGCVATGETPERVRKNIREAMAFHLEGLRKDGLPMPEGRAGVEFLDAQA
jgi:predicted RNase H-like HicB family nuclease